MKKRDREQLRASIAKDLVQGQCAHSPTKELLRQYAPLDGVITPNVSPQPGRALPVENTLAPPATVAQNDHSPWHDATEARGATLASPATVARYAMVPGELRVPNTINFSLFPTLNPFARAVYYQLFLTVTDSAGVSVTVEQDILPHKVNFTAQASVPNTFVSIAASQFSSSSGTCFSAAA